MEPQRQGPDDGLVFHYTKASTALEHILESMEIRLSPISDTNDPWEARREKTGFSSPGSPLPDLGAMAKVDEIVRRARVACFCRDGEVPSRDPCSLNFAPPWAGWARDRMWAQYADGHRGVCLAFDRSKLVDAFNTALPNRGDRIAQNVTYSDDARSLSFDNDRLRAVGVQQYAAEYRRQHAQARYLTKRLDWKGEQEFRLVLLEEDPTAGDALVRIRDALAYVMMGDRFPRGYLPCIDAVMRQYDIPAYRLRYEGEVYAMKYFGSK